MIESIALRLAIGLNNYTGNKSISVDHVRYKFAEYIQISIIWLISLVIGFFADNFVETVAALVIIGYFRYLTGGFHLSLDYCVLLTITFVVISSSFDFGNVIIFSIITSVLVMFYGHKDKRKYVALALIFANVFVQSHVAMNCFLLQSLTLIPFRGGDKHD